MKVRLSVILLLILLYGSGIRMVDINKPLVEFYRIRQYRALHIARAMYFEGNESIPVWRREIAKQNAEGPMEPPVMENIAVAGYRILGSEQIWFPRTLSAIFWTVAAVCLFFITKKLTGNKVSAVVSVIVFMLFPDGVLASRAFMPDPLMVMLMLAAILMILKYHEAPSRKMLAAAAVISSVAMLVKPMSGFLLFAVLIAQSINEKGIRNIVNKANVIFCGISVIAPASYYIYGLFIAGFLKGQAGLSFTPSMLALPGFWLGWLKCICFYSIGIPLFVVSLASIPFFKKGTARITVVSLWLGYIILGLVFHYHISTHGYYSLYFLLPLASLSVGCIAGRIIEKAHVVLQKKGWQIAVAVVLIVTAYANNSVLLSKVRYSEVKSMLVEQAEIIGGVVSHKPCIIMEYDYGYLLKYHGEMTGVAWPNLSWDFRFAKLKGQKIPTAEERFAEMTKDFSPAYFVIIATRELSEQPDLKALVKQYKIVPNFSGALIFDLREKAK